MRKHIELPCKMEPWDGRVVDANDMYVDIEQVLVRVNNYDRLREALREVSELDYMSMENALAWIEDNCPDIRALLQELDNLEQTK